MTNIDLTADLLKVLVDHKVITEANLEIYVRNRKIERRYIELIEGGMQPKDARQQLADAEFFVSEKTIESIIYCKKDK